MLLATLSQELDFALKQEGVANTSPSKLLLRKIINVTVVLMLAVVKKKTKGQLLLLSARALPAIAAIFTQLKKFHSRA